MDKQELPTMNEQAQKFIDEFNETYPDRELIFLIKAGSHFFDLNSPTSDTDFRGIYMPSKKEFYEGEPKRRFFERKTLEGNKTGIKNTKDDVDFYLFSYTFFLDLLARGDFNCMEMLHAPEDKIIINNSRMDALTQLRQSLLVNDISAFLGFIKKEYRRYGINMNHYKIQEDFANFLREFPPHTRLNEIWGKIERYGKHDNQIIFTTSLTGNNKRVPTLKVAQRLYQDTVKTSYIVDMIDTRLKRYGHRQKNMAKSGVEFKGLYHALRLIYEANDLFDYGEFKLPFNSERHSMLKKIKGSDVTQEFVFNLIDSEIEKLFNREHELKRNGQGNRHSVEYIINKIKFKLEGTKKIQYIMGV